MIFKGETQDSKREVIFSLVDISNGDLRITGWTFSTGQIKVAAPGGSTGNADVTRIREIGGGSYALRLTDAQVTNAGSGVVIVDPSLSVAVPVTYNYDVVDPDDLADDGTTQDNGGTLLPAGLITLALLRDIVRKRGDFLSSLTFDDDYLDIEIQAAWVELFELMDDTNENWWDTQDTVTTVASQVYVALPSTCKRVQGADILCGSDYQELRQVPSSWRNRYGSTTGRPEAYRLSARGLELFPTPNSAYTLRVTFSPICPALSEDTGVELYGLQEYIIVGALLRLFTREERPTGEIERELERQKQRVIKAASMRQQQEPEYLTLREGYDLDWGGMY